MLTRIINRIIRKQEANLGASLDYLCEVARISPAAFFKIGVFSLAARHRKRLPRTAYHLAIIAATRHEDAGTCVQIGVNLALKEGVPPHFIRAVLEDRFEELPAALHEVCDFARGISEGWESPGLRATLRSRYGDEGIMELGLAIAGARVYPTLKRALGYPLSSSITTITA